MEIPPESNVTAFPTRTRGASSPPLRCSSTIKRGSLDADRPTVSEACQSFGLDPRAVENLEVHTVLLGDFARPLREVLGRGHVGRLVGEIAGKHGPGSDLRSEICSRLGLFQLPFLCDEPEGLGFVPVRGALVLHEAVQAEPGSLRRSPRCLLDIHIRQRWQGEGGFAQLEGSGAAGDGGCGAAKLLGGGGVPLAESHEQQSRRGAFLPVQ